MAELEITDMPENLLRALRESHRRFGGPLDHEIIIRLERSTGRRPYDPRESGRPAPPEDRTSG